MKSLKHFLHKTFIPSHLNCYRPHAFRHLMLSVYSLALLLSQLSFGVVQYTPAANNPVELGNSVFTKINQERTNNSEVVLKENALLSQAAESKLNDMFQNNYWDHTSPTGVKAWEFINKSGYSYSSAGENLAKGFYSSDKMVDAWMKSPSHKGNILNNEFTETGIAVGNGKINGRVVTVAVQLFGAPSKAFAQSETIVAGEKSTSPKFSLSSPVSPARLPYFLFYLIIFAFIIFDGTMLRANKCHKDKKHLLAFRASLGLNIVFLAILCINLAQIW